MKAALSYRLPQTNPVFLIFPQCSKNRCACLSNPPPPFTEHTSPRHPIKLLGCRCQTPTEMHRGRLKWSEMEAEMMKRRGISAIFFFVFVVLPLSHGRVDPCVKCRGEMGGNDSWIFYRLCFCIIAIVAKVMGSNTAGCLSVLGFSTVVLWVIWLLVSFSLPGTPVALMHLLGLARERHFKLWIFVS